jgi:hypothetical protein
VAAPGWTAGAEAAGHVAAPELPRAGQRELEPQDTWRPRSCLGLGSGSWSRRARGGPGAASGWAAGAGATGHVVVLELPRAGQQELEPQGTWRPRSCTGLGSGSWSRRTRGGAEAHLSSEARPELQLAWQRVDTRPAPCLDLELVCWVPSLQGTDTGCCWSTGGQERKRNLI